MRYFLTLYVMRLKAALRSPATLLCAGLFLVLTAAFGAVLPGDAPAALTVGILPGTEIGREALELLRDNGDYTIRAYTDREALREDVLYGRLHCGYEISGEWAGEKKPVTVYYSDASYLRPLMDQLVLSACFEGMLPRMVEDYFEQSGFDRKDAAALLEKQRLEAKAMEVELKSLGKPMRAERDVSRSMQPLLYAVLASLFLAVSVVEAVLTPPSRGRALGHMARLSGHRMASAAAPVLAVSTVHLIVLLAADAALGFLFEGNLYYPAAARVTMLLLLAAAAALPAMAAGALQKRAFAVAAALPPWLLAGVFFSGALISPELFPAGLGILRFLSPGWYALQWMSLF